MIDLLKNFASPFVIAYILGVIAIPILAPSVAQIAALRRKTRRKNAGLSEAVLRNPGEGLAQQRAEAIIETSIVLVLGSILPLILLWMIDHTGWVAAENQAPEKEKINLAFTAFLLWALVSGTPLAKNFLGGLSFRSLAIFTRPIQVGDRVTIAGHHGILREIGIFYTKIETLDDDLISIPSSMLLEEVLSSTNAGESPSLCSIPFYLAPASSADQRQQAEDIIWDSIQSSIYFDFGKPLKILLKQELHAISLTAKCYVTSTYEEANFTSEVTKRVLKAFSDQGIPLSKSGPPVIR